MHVYIESNITQHMLDDLRLLLERNIDDPDNPTCKTNIQDEMVFKLFRGLFNGVNNKNILSMDDITPDLLEYLESNVEDINYLLKDVLGVNEPLRHYQLKDIVFNNTLIELNLEERTT